METVSPILDERPRGTELTPLVADFIDERPGEEPVAQDDTAHRRLDRTFGRNEQESVEDIVQRLKERHGKMAASKYNGDSDLVPQRLLMPGVNDPSLWTVRCKVSGKRSMGRLDGS